MEAEEHQGHPGLGEILGTHTKSVLQQAGKVINRPGVAGAVLQTPMSLINLGGQ